MLEAFRQTLTQSEEALHAFGMRAKAFVMETKTNFVQAQKLMHFIETVHKKED